MRGCRQASRQVGGPLCAEALARLCLRRLLPVALPGVQMGGRAAVIGRGSRPAPPCRARAHVEGVGKEGEGEEQAAQLAPLVHLLVVGLGGGVPALVSLHVAVLQGEGRRPIRRAGERRD